MSNESNQKGFMQKFMDWMSEVVAPKLETIANNPWISALQKSILKTVPMVLVGSLITVFNVVRKYITTLPDLSPISSYTFGLLSVFMVFLIPYYVMDNLKNNKMKYIAAFTSVSLFFIILNPDISDAGYLYNFSGFGAGGMIVAIVAGLFTAFVMNLFNKITFFKEDSVMPDFVREWFDSMIPIFLVVFVGWLVVIQLGFNMYDFIVNLFAPIMNIAQSWPGMVLLYLIPTILYSMGISGWVFQPILGPVTLVAISANAEAVAAGLAPQFPFTGPTSTAWLSLGGRGATFVLVFLMMLSKSRSLKALGRASFIPNLLNINEPVVFGAIAWQPILMIPMWILGFILPTITFIVLKAGLVPIPSEVFSLWYFPIGITSWLVTKNISGVILTLVNLLVSLGIWYPFFKVYEARKIEEETGTISAN